MANMRAYCACSILRLLELCVLEFAKCRVGSSGTDRDCEYPAGLWINYASWDCETDLYTWNGQQQVINEVTRRGFAELIPLAEELLQRPLVLNSNVILRNEPSTRLFVWDWLGMAVARPRAFCSSHVQDQAAFTILLFNRSLPHRER